MFEEAENGIRCYCGGGGGGMTRHRLGRQRHLRPEFHVAEAEQHIKCYCRWKHLDTKLQSKEALQARLHVEVHTSCCHCRGQ